MKVYNIDIVGDRFVKNEDNNLVLADKEKLCVSKAHYVEFS